MGALPQHAYSIPYHFTPAEARAWLDSELGNRELQDYLGDPQTRPAGMMIPDGYAQIIVWYDASHVLHVIDATNLAVARHVNDAAYQSPDSSIVQNAIDELQKLAANAASWLVVAAVAAALYFVQEISR